MKVSEETLELSRFVFIFQFQFLSLRRRMSITQFSKPFLMILALFVSSIVLPSSDTSFDIQL